jgi:hypothetical protein
MEKLNKPPALKEQKFQGKIKDVIADLISCKEHMLDHYSSRDEELKESDIDAEF